jgi:hypothetical protein
MAKRAKTSKPGRKATTKPVLADLKPTGERAIKGGKGTSTNERRKDPYKNFNF